MWSFKIRLSSIYGFKRLVRIGGLLVVITTGLPTTLSMCDWWHVLPSYLSPRLPLVAPWASAQPIDHGDQYEPAIYLEYGQAESCSSSQEEYQLTPPLHGLRVLDCTIALAGPYASLILADLGADVIKIENPVQPNMRTIGSDAATEKPWGAKSSRVEKEDLGPYKGENGKFLITNRNKRGMAIDLKSAEGKEIFFKLLDTADILVQNFRPGVMDRLGFGWEDLKKIKPRLIYCSISGFGAGSPYAALGGLDLIAQGMSGLMTLTGLPDSSEPIKAGTPITDMGTGMYGVIGILAALRELDKSGRGQHVEATLLDTPISWLTWRAAEYWESGEIPEPQGSGNGTYRSFRCSDDRWVNISASSQKLFEIGCDVIGRPDLVTDDRFSSANQRTKNAKEITAEFQTAFLTKSSSEWIELFQRTAVPVGPINTIADILDNDPHVVAREMVVEVDHQVIGKMKTLGIPVKLSETPGEITMAAPTLGQHTSEILKELNYSEEQINSMADNKIIAVSS